MTMKDIIETIWAIGVPFLFVWFFAPRLLKRTFWVALAVCTLLGYGLFRLFRRVRRGAHVRKSEKGSFS
jgi:hypothetical protein